MIKSLITDKCRPYKIQGCTYENHMLSPAFPKVNTNRPRGGIKVELIESDMRYKNVDVRMPQSFFQGKDMASLSKLMASNRYNTFEQNYWRVVFVVICSVHEPNLQLSTSAFHNNNED